jgi:hypothetical protein
VHVRILSHRHLRQINIRSYSHFASSPHSHKMSKLLPQPLPQECVKATKILQSFISSGSGGLDGVIPREVLSKAKGFAIFSVVKAGFLFSARAGTGIVIARLDDGSTSLSLPCRHTLGTILMTFYREYKQAGRLLVRSELQEWALEDKQEPK